MDLCGQSKSLVTRTSDQTLPCELLNTLRAAAFQILKVNLTNWVHWPKLKLRVEFFLLTKCSGLVIERMLASDDRAMPVGMSR